ncbi:MAG: NADH-quinone oxidoreductase subunit K [Deltaproteobacteria bacterium]|nr:NADH-quinone oxidoreductase subunit K [Deltaproteobacteria bacterium]
MTPLLYASSGVAVFAIALYRIFTAGDVLRKIIAANLLGGGVFLILVAIARRPAAGIDPVPHALVLTGIVVSVSATACALALARRLEGTTLDDGDDGDDGSDDTEVAGRGP